MPTLRASATAIVLLASLTACVGDEEPWTSPSPSPSARPDPVDGPCLVTREQLNEITGTEQTIVEVPSEGLAEFICATTLDDRYVVMQWFLEEPSAGRPQTHQEQRIELDDLGLTVEEASLGKGQTSWVGMGKPIAYPYAQVNAQVNDQSLEVMITAYDEGSPLTVVQIREESLALARAVVAATSK